MRAYERLIRYVKVYTASDATSATCPSTAVQFDLGKLLVEELLGMGIADARMDEKGYVYGSLPATPGYEDKPAVIFISHMDTISEVPSENVNPILHENYDGCDVTLPNGNVLSVETFPFLKEMKGETLITTDGTTILGGDDKAGIAEIITAVETLMNGDRPHGKVCFCFNPDEEIGRGAFEFDIPGCGAEFGYTVDGSGVGTIEYENFNAAAATVDFKGFSVHPGTSKNTMINAANVAIEFHDSLPSTARPECTEGYEGFAHLTSMSGNVTDAKLTYILRDHDWNKLSNMKDNMAHIAKILNEKYGEGTVTLDIKDQYRNMVEKVKPHFHLIENGREAIRMAGLEPETVPIRGGTDGATLSWMGLPCPNLGCGGYNFHGPSECITVERMDKTVEIILNVISLYAK